MMKEEGRVAHLREKRVTSSGPCRDAFIPSVVPAPLLSFRHPFCHSGESRNPRRLPGADMPAGWRKGVLYGGIRLMDWREWASATAGVARRPKLNLPSPRVGVTEIPAFAGKTVALPELRDDSRSQCSRCCRPAFNAVRCSRRCRSRRKREPCS